MKRISSRSSFLYKRVIPILWFVGLGIFAVDAAFVSLPERGGSFWYFLALAFAGVLGFFFMKMTVFDLADEVFDAGDALVVCVGQDKRRIPLAEITNVKYSPMMSPPRVILALGDPSKFGKEVAFSAPLTFGPFMRSPIVTDLIERIDAARRSMTPRSPSE